MSGITKQQFNTLEDLFVYYNNQLFNGTLPYCLVNLSRHRTAAGFFITANWKGGNGDIKHEISINPDTLHKGDEYWHSTLVHEMCHMWQTEFGKPSRSNYHNKEWANKMIEVGLMPSDTGKEGGKITGQRMSDYVIKDGSFNKSFLAIGKKNLKNLSLPYKMNISIVEDEEIETPDEAQVKGEKKSGVKRKYLCGCGNKVWGKSGLKLLCATCRNEFQEQE